MFNNNDLFLVLLVTLCASTPARAEALPAASGHALDSMAPVGRSAARIELRANSYDKW